MALDSVPYILRRPELVLEMFFQKNQVGNQHPSICKSEGFHSCLLNLFFIFFPLSQCCGTLTLSPELTV